MTLIRSVIKLKETIDELSAIINVEKENGLEKVNLVELLNEVISSIRTKLLQSNTKINIELEEEEIFFTKKYVRSILLNLITNAVKYKSQDREPELEIKSQKMDGFTVLSIQDNGMGIANEKIGQLFSKFKRVHDLDTEVNGSGIGLYLVKKMLTNAGGEIEVESKLGEGSCFKVYFKE